MHEIYDSPFLSHVSADPLEVAPRGGPSHIPRGLVPDVPHEAIDRRAISLQTFEGIDTYQEGVQNISKTAPAGLAVVRFGPVPPGQVWLIERTAIKSQSVPVTSVFLYVVGAGYPCQSASEPFPDFFLADASTSGNLDVSDNNSPVLVPGGHELVLCWTGLTAAGAAKCSARVQYQVLAV